MSTGKAVVERPPDPKDTKDGEYIPQRTVEQQEKAENSRAIEDRANNEMSNRTRSQSRRDRRKRIRGQQEEGKYMKTNSLEALEEADANGEMLAMQPFDRIGPDSTSMNGPVTNARALRGEIPVRGTNGQQPYYLDPKETGEDNAVSCSIVVDGNVDGFC